MKFEQYINEKTIDSATGDDNLLVMLTTNKDKHDKQFWQVVVMNTEEDRELERNKFYDETEAKKKFEKVKKAF